MNIAVIRRECGHCWGGAERYCAQVVKILTEFGHKVTLIARQRDGFTGEVDFVPVRYEARGSLLKNYLFFTKTRQLLLGAGFDVVYGLSRVHPVDVFRVTDPLHAAWISRRHEGRLQRRLAALSLRHRLLLSLEKKVISDPHVRIVLNSKLVASEIERFYGLSRTSSRLRVIYNGVDLQQFNPAARRAGKLLREKLGLQNKTILLFVGADLRRKGFQTVIKALAASRYKNVSLLAVGPNKEDVSVRLPATMRERLMFVGRVTRPEVYYGAADLLVLPTRYDPFANVCLEALSCGTPVLTTAANGAAEIIEPGNTGFVMTDPQDHQELREKLDEYLCLSEKSRVLMGEQASILAKQFTWERHGEILLEVFEGLTDKL